VPYSERGRMTDEGLAFLRECWTNPTPTFDGHYYRVADVAFEPRPVQEPLPVLVGGNSKAALRRAARHQGWHPNVMFLTDEQLARALDYLRDQPDFAGKESTFEVVLDLLPPATPPFGTASASERRTLLEWFVDNIRALEAKGATGVSVPAVPAASFEDYLESLSWFADEVLPLVREP
jgi:hypothetical protein